MNNTRFVLQKMATVISTQGLHTGSQFAVHGPMDKLDICAAAFIVAEDRPAPPEFFTDEIVSIAVIEASPRAMAAIRTISDVLDSDVCETEVEPGLYVPDYIEHVSNWAATAPIGEKTPPTTAEVVGRILRAANHAAQHATPPSAA